jgi:hypothetical protein
MKRFILSTLLVLALVSTSWAIKTYNCDYLTGGDQRAVDYLSVSDLNNGDRAIVAYKSGVSDYLYYFKYDSSGTTAENTSAHPYFIRPNDYATKGVWYECSPSWMALDGTLSLNNLTVSGTLTTNHVAASGKLSGGIPYEAASGTSTVSGTTLYGGYIYGAAGAGVTRTLPTATGAGENVVFFNVGNTYISGGTLYVHFTSGDTIYCNQTITAGTSKFILAGVSTWTKQILAISTEANHWIVKTVGSPTVDWD